MSNSSRDRIASKKLTDSGYDTLLHPPNSRDLSPTDYKYLMHLDTFFLKKKDPKKHSVPKTKECNILVFMQKHSQHNNDERNTVL